MQYKKNEEKGTGYEEPDTCLRDRPLPMWCKADRKHQKRLPYRKQEIHVSVRHSMPTVVSTKLISQSKTNVEKENIAIKSSTSMSRRGHCAIEVRSINHQGETSPPPS